MSIAQRLRTEREHRKLGQHEVAAAIGVSRPTVSQWEKGTKKPGRDNLEALAVFYRLSLDELLGAPSNDGRIVAESAEEAQAILLLRQAPQHVREAVLTLLGSSIAVSTRPDKVAPQK
jgi:transcriptional regulator with XRE-family HTH domain